MVGGNGAGGADVVGGAEGAIGIAVATDGSTDVAASGSRFVK